MPAQCNPPVRNSDASPTKKLIAVITARELCGACLKGLLQASFQRLDVMVFSREANLIDAVTEGCAPEVIIYSAVCQASLDLELLRRLVAQLPSVPLAVHVEVSENSAVNRLLKLGVKGVLPTTISPEIASAALKVIAGGGTYVPPVDGELHKSPKASTPTLARDLTERQAAVLGLVAVGRTNKEIARALGLTQNTVKVHLARLMRRLNATNRVQLARLAPSVLGKNTFT
jgi:DNA-binding NarL/FixJ family response regulator